MQCGVSSFQWLLFFLSAAQAAAPLYLSFPVNLNTISNDKFKLSTNYTEVSFLIHPCGKMVRGMF